MKVIHTFPCLLSVYRNQSSDDITLIQTKLELYSNRIVLCISKCNFELQTSIEKYSFEISFKLALKWKCHKDKLSELQFNQFSIQAESGDLLLLKGYLDCKTTYSGIKELYSNAELTFQQEFTKICTLRSRLTGTYHHCRCFKKELMNKHQVQEILTNVRELANSKNICKVLEYFESSNSYYLVYEELRAIQVIDLTHEDIQSIMFDILQSIKTLIENQIFHSKIQITSFWMDNQLVCKLGALEYMHNQQELTNESEMIARAGQIMLQLYSVQLFLDINLILVMIIQAFQIMGMNCYLDCQTQIHMPNSLLRKPYRMNISHTSITIPVPYSINKQFQNQKNMQIHTLLIRHPKSKALFDFMITLLKYHFWTTSKHLNPNYLQAEFAVRGLVPSTALLIQDKMNQGMKYPFDSITDLSNGNPQIFGQKPISFYRSVISSLLDTSILKYKSQDVQRRVQYYQDKMKQPIGAYNYDQPLGFDFVRQAIVKFIKKRDGTSMIPSIDDIILTDGACGAITILFHLLLKSNHGVMIPIPQYPLYSALITQCGASIIPYYLNEERTWQTSQEELSHQYELAIAKGIIPKILVCINPGNPTGQVFEEQTIIDMINFAAEKKLIIFADEVYQDNVYFENKKFISFRKVALRINKDVEIFSFHSISKGIIGECGVRGGYFEITTPIDQRIYQEIIKAKSLLLGSNCIGQVMTGLAFNPPSKEEGCSDETVDEFNSECTALYQSLKRRAEIVTQQLNQVEGVQCQPTEGAMYAFPNLYFPDKFIQHSKSLGYTPDQTYCLDLLQDTGIVVVPGSGFLQKPGTHHFRMTTLILPEENLLAKMRVFKEWHEKYIRKFM